MHNISNLFYFGTALYMFRTVSPSIIRNLRLHILHQVHVVHLVGFTIEIYYKARSHERQICWNLLYSFRNRRRKKKQPVCRLYVTKHCLQPATPITLQLVLRKTNPSCGCLCGTLTICSFVRQYFVYRAAYCNHLLTCCVV